MKLLDSNIVIALASNDDDAVNHLVLESSYSFSVVTRIAVLGYHKLTQEDKSDLQAFLASGAGQIFRKIPEGDELSQPRVAKLP